ncbi:gag-pol polyprotein [Tanacetum coccineum]
MFALTVSTDEPKNIKEAIDDQAWIEAMKEELHQFDRLKVWELVDKSFGKIDEAIDFEESFTPVAHLEAEEVYVSQLDTFVDPDHPEKVYHLRKTLYGLKQALRALYDELSTLLMSKAFTKVKGNYQYGTLYPKDFGFELTSFLEADHAGCLDNRKSTSRRIQFLSDKLVSNVDEDTT